MGKIPVGFGKRGKFHFFRVFSLSEPQSPKFQLLKNSGRRRSRKNSQIFSSWEPLTCAGFHLRRDGFRLHRSSREKFQGGGEAAPGGSEYKGNRIGFGKKKKGDEGRIPKTPGAWEAPEDVQGRGASGIWSFPTLPGAPLGWGRKNPTFPAAGMVLGTLQIFIGKGKMEKWGPAGV